jgi:hypothetical protein
MENVGIVYGRLDYIAAIWYILWPFGDLVFIWYVFNRSGILYHEKSGNPGWKGIDMKSGLDSTQNLTCVIKFLKDSYIFMYVISVRNYMYIHN